MYKNSATGVLTTNVLTRTQTLTLPVFILGDMGALISSMVKAILVLNLIDAILTMYWVKHGLAQEMNPLLANTVLNFPIVFVLIKLSLVGLGVCVLWRNRSNQLAIGAICLALAAYYGLFLYHISFISYTVKPLAFL